MCLLPDGAPALGVYERLGQGGGVFQCWSEGVIQQFQAHHCQRRNNLSGQLWSICEKIILIFALNNQTQESTKANYLLALQFIFSRDSDLRTSF